MEALCFSATFGVERGYRPETQVSDALIGPAIAVAYKWQDAATREFDKSGVSVGGVVTPSITVYVPKHGCPRGGENTATVTGSNNPKFSSNEDFYAALRRVVLDVKDALRQTTVRLDVWESEQTYTRQEVLR